MKERTGGKHDWEVELVVFAIECGFLWVMMKNEIERQFGRRGSIDTEFE